MKSIFFIFLCGLFWYFSVGCESEVQDAAVIEVDFKWNPPCTSVLKSPEIHLKAIPEGTARFFIGLTDLDLKT